MTEKQPVFVPKLRILGINLPEHIPRAALKALVQPSPQPYTLTP